MLEHEDQIEHDRAHRQNKLHNVEPASTEELVRPSPQRIDQLLQKREQAPREIKHNVVNIPSHCALTLEIQIHLTFTTKPT